MVITAEMEFGSSYYLVNQCFWSIFRQGIRITSNIWVHLSQLRSMHLADLTTVEQCIFENDCMREFWMYFYGIIKTHYYNNNRFEKYLFFSLMQLTFSFCDQMYFMFNPQSKHLLTCLWLAYSTSHASVARHAYAVGKVKWFGEWTTHWLSVANKTN